MRPKKLILEVADDAAIRDLVALVCEESGFQVLQAECGDEALKLYRKHGPVALVLTDLYYYDHIPEPPLEVKAIRTGIQLAMAIRELEPEQQIVIHSASSPEAVAAEMPKELSGIAVLHKGSDSFMQELRSLLANLQSLDEQSPLR